MQEPVVAKPAATVADVAQVQQPSQMDMRQMMEAAQGMQACMAGIDEATIQRLRQRTQQMEAEIGQLCRAGQPVAAQARALDLGRQMAGDPVFKTMQTCIARLPKLPMGQAESPLGQLYDDEPVDGNPQSFCERFR